MTERRIYSNGVTRKVMTEAEFEKGGYAHQAFVDVGSADPDERTEVEQEPKVTTDKKSGKKEKK